MPIEEIVPNLNDNVKEKTTNTVNKIKSFDIKPPRVTVKEMVKKDNLIIGKNLYIIMVKLLYL